MKRPLTVFLLIVAALTGALSLILWRMGGMASKMYTPIAAAMMLIPGIASLLSRIICEEGFGDLGIRPRFRGHGRLYLAAWLAPALFTVLGGIIFFLIFPDSFDAKMSGYAAALEAQGASAPIELLVAAQAVSALTLGPLINLLPALGEELGWRGYLLPRLMRCTSTSRAVLLSGLIWGVWHAPLIAMGHNYGLTYPGAPWLGILTMTFACVLLGAFLSWLFVRTGSAIPCALAHGALNAIAGLGIFWVNGTVNPLLGPMALTWIGGIPMFALGAWCWHSLARKGKSEVA